MYRKKTTVIAFLLYLLLANLMPGASAECSFCGVSQGRFYRLPDQDIVCEKCYSLVQLRCESCGEAFSQGEQFFTYQKGSERFFCQDCVKLPKRCMFCSVPIGSANQGYHYGEGMQSCAVDAAKSRVYSNSEARRFFDSASQKIQATFGPSMKLNYNSSNIQLVKASNLLKLSRQSHVHEKGSILLGLTQGRPGNLSSQQVHMLWGLPQDVFLKTAIHEYAHLWLNVYGNSKIVGDAKVQEGFAEWVAQKTLGESVTEWRRRLQMAPYAYREGYEGFLYLEQELGAQAIIEMLVRGQWVQVK